MSEIIESTRKKMNELLAQREKDLSICEQEIAIAQGAIYEAESDQAAAVENMSVKKFEESKKIITRNKTLVEMYENRKRQIERKELIHEDESDRVIDALLDHEEEITAEYNDKARELISQLEELTNVYQNEICKTEGLITEWTLSIHENYRSSNAIYRNGTNRCEHAIPVRMTAYSGNTLSNITAEYTEKARHTEADTPLRLNRV